jgi:hypothetical protein
VAVVLVFQQQSTVRIDPFASTQLEHFAQIHDTLLQQTDPVLR